MSLGPNGAFLTSLGSHVTTASTPGQMVPNVHPQSHALPVMAWGRNGTSTTQAPISAGATPGVFSRIGQTLRGFAPARQGGQPPRQITPTGNKPRLTLNGM